MIVGYSYINNTYYHAFSYSGGTMTDIGTLGTNVSSLASHVNASGQVMGKSFLTGSGYHAFRWTP